MLKEKVFIETDSVNDRGCYSLYYQVRKLLGFLGGAYEYTKDYKEADYIIVLSCIVVPKFINDNISYLEKYTQTEAQVILYGCLSKHIHNMFLDTFGEKIHIIRHEDEASFDNIFTEAQIKFEDSEAYNKSPNDEKDVFLNSKKSSNHIVVNKGCKHNCNFCIIREGKKIKTVEDIKILKDVKNKLENGMNHFRITSDDISTYGIDNKADLFSLIERILALDPEITLELGPVYPSFILDNKKEFYKLLKTGRITAIFSAIQHRNKRVLELMNRGDYDHSAFEKLILMFRKEFSQVKIGTHLIYGYPGETHEEFLDNLKNVAVFDQIQFHMYTPNYKTERLELDAIDESTLFERRYILEKKLSSMKEFRIYSDDIKFCIIRNEFDTKEYATEKYF